MLLDREVVSMGVEYVGTLCTGPCEPKTAPKIKLINLMKRIVTEYVW